MIEHHSYKIQNVIQKELFNAKQSIKIVVAWFTNDLLFQPLVLKQGAGVKVEIILNRDEINCSNENNVMYVSCAGSINYNTISFHDIGFRPIVCLSSDVVISRNQDGTYNIK